MSYAKALVRDLLVLDHLMAHLRGGGLTEVPSCGAGVEPGPPLFTDVQRSEFGMRKTVTVGEVRSISMTLAALLFCDASVPAWRFPLPSR